MAWSGSFFDISIIKDIHRLCLYIDIGSALKDSTILFRACDVIQNDIDRYSGNNSGGIGIHIIFNVEIEVETNDDEIDDKLELLGAFRRKIEEVFYSTCNGCNSTNDNSNSSNDASIQDNMLNSLDIGDDIDIGIKSSSSSSSGISISSNMNDASSSKLVDTYNKNMLRFTICCNVISATIMDFLFDTKKYRNTFELFLLSYQINRENTVDKLIDFNKRYSGKIQLGIGFDTPFDELQWIIVKVPAGIVSVVLIGFMNFLPNMYMRQIDLIHTLGVNAMVILRNCDMFEPIDRLNYLSEYVPHYNSNAAALNTQTNETLLVRLLLQKGVVVGISTDLYDSTIINSIFNIKHPFTYRKPFAAGVDYKRFYIDADDVESILAISEMRESVNDREAEYYATHSKPPRKLTSAPSKAL